jgi:hypothetical protein
VNTVKLNPDGSIPLMPPTKERQGFHIPVTDDQSRVAVDVGASGVVAGGASEATLQAIEAILNLIEQNTDQLEVVIGDVDVNTDALEAKADAANALLTAIDVNTDALEAKADAANALLTAIEALLTAISGNQGRTAATVTQDLITNANAAVPVPLAGAPTPFKWLMVIGSKGWQEDYNADLVFIGPSSVDGEQPFEVSSGRPWIIEAPNDEVWDLADWYLDVKQVGDGLILFYS